MPGIYRVPGICEMPGTCRAPPQSPFARTPVPSLIRLPSLSSSPKSCIITISDSYPVPLQIMTGHNDIAPMQHDTTGSGAPLVLLPGGLTGWLSWQPHAQRLAASYRVTRLQLHSVQFGLAGAPLPATYAVDYEVAALGKTLDHLALPQAHLAGWSYGAVISLSYAIHNPQRVRSLTLIEPSAFWILRSRGPLPAQALLEQEYMQTLARDDIDEARMIAFAHTVALAPKDVDPRTLPQWPVWFQHRQSLRIGDAEFRHDDSIDLLRAFHKPVLVVKGQGSTSHLHATADLLAQELPNARAITLPGGHAPHIASMQPFLDHLTHFLSDQNPAAPESRVRK